VGRSRGRGATPGPLEVLGSVGSSDPLARQTGSSACWVGGGGGGWALAGDLVGAGARSDAVDAGGVRPTVWAISSTRTPWATSPTPAPGPPGSVEARRAVDGQGDAGVRLRLVEAVTPLLGRSGAMRPGWQGVELAAARDRAPRRGGAALAVSAATHHAPTGRRTVAPPRPAPPARPGSARLRIAPLRCTHPGCWRSVGPQS
jgi:hypothetical protein